MPKRRTLGLIFFMLLGAPSCCPFSVTAVSDAQLNKGCWCQHPEGIPFYLPKPLLIISKNFQYIEESTVGLTQPVPVPNSFDKQDTFATLNAQAGISTASESPSPPSSPDGQSARSHVRSMVGAGGGGPGTSDACCSTQVLHSSGAPVVPDPSKIAAVHTPFFTYQIIFVPDLTQKHYLRIRGGPGEVRATLNMVNGWMFTGLGPFYLKDSSTAQNILATGVLAKFAGSGAADVINSVANLSKTLQAGGSGMQKLAMADQMMRGLADRNQPGFVMPQTGGSIQAEIHVFEPHLSHDGDTEWREITHPDKCFTGQYLGRDSVKSMISAAAPQLTQEAAAKDLENVRAMQRQILDTVKEMDARESAARDLILPAAVKAAMDPSADAAALQKLTPPPQAKKGWFDWICPHPRLANNQVDGPTSAQ